MKIPKTITDWVLRSPVFSMHINELEFDLYLSQNGICLFGNDIAIREKYIPMFPKKKKNHPPKTYYFVCRILMVLLYFSG